MTTAIAICVQDGIEVYRACHNGTVRNFFNVQFARQFIAANAPDVDLNMIVPTAVSNDCTPLPDYTHFEYEMFGGEFDELKLTGGLYVYDLK